ncbi:MULTISPECIES: helix-turn-helix transcriptional regulator [unclassified Solwaraspora]|uniref:helix-turn-helix domain-containing protein n=1 Tax=unclassified Solwaraspora TaxID=2627926 RepID=UPI002415D462|nr:MULTISPECIES: helix-turn-helix transcriptional regulator [unclassified Solwaraspora]MDG4774198.1 helix-turn-helix transcriptional regulator [Solwaraspora sp. WMMD792]WBB96775.1 helix-turn-helix transcriptional regulator [Solwaraspora sp. WMMA2059]WBC19321.1 helix-turn-helix transcriptional regulator [Solwaraspora sp. WMMA2080]
MTELPVELRRLRLSQRMNQTQLAKAVGVSKSLIASFETGRLVPKEDTAKDLDKLLNSGDQLQQLSREGREDRQPWLRSWVDHERRAVLLRAWEPTLVPGLLQTEAYMRQVFTGVPSNRGRLEEVIATRQERQRAVLDRDPPVDLVVLVEETALRRGPREVMKDQLAHLVDLGHRPTIRIRAVPESAGLHAGLSGPLALATMSDGRRVGYLDDLLRGRLATTAGDVLELELIWEAVNELALSADQTRDLMLRMIQ